MARFNRSKQAAFLAAFAACGTVRRACEAAGISTALHYNWLDRDPDYRPQFEEATQKSIYAMEAEARQRAIEGLRQYKFTAKGESIPHPLTGEPYYEDKRSDVLLIFLLKGMAPEKYRDNIAATVNGEIQHSHTIEQLRAALDEARRDQLYVELRRAATIRHGLDTGANGHNGHAGSVANGQSPEAN